MEERYRGDKGKTEERNGSPEKDIRRKVNASPKAECEGQEVGSRNV